MLRRNERIVKHKIGLPPPPLIKTFCPESIFPTSMRLCTARLPPWEGRQLPQSRIKWFENHRL